MKKIETIEELHGLLLDIGIEFHRICVKNNIPYYMLGGTQLGASRHKGFIPWDDDMDFGIPREHYERFIGIAQKELAPQYTLRTIDNSNYIFNGMAKIELNTTVIKEHFAADQDEKIGVFIDVFPLDKTNNNFSFFSKNKMIPLTGRFVGYRFMTLRNRPIQKKIAALLVKFFLYPLTPKGYMYFVKKHLITNEGNYVANHFGAWETKETMPKEYFGEPRLYTFESTEFYGVSDFESYLTHLYGNWRQLPPVKARTTHVVDMYYK